ncbi:MAG: dihydrofolate reductase [Planctomycetota bacterium]|nr:dihydrofolate reductase [Planctomycetota bacterium]MDA1180270.1 dihydrofolate reductase [Planctomycetota bacterium]
MSDRPEVTLIVAMTQDRLIGCSGMLPWHLPSDLRRFRDLTMGHALLMGRKTFESIGRCLPGRTSIVVTRQSNFDGKGALLASSWEEALRLVPSGLRAFVIGGAEIYHQSLPDVTRMYITFVDGSFDGDTFFPPIAWEEWLLLREEIYPADAKNQHATRFAEFVRRTDG